MYRRLPVLKDTYLTDRVIDGVRHDRTNVGAAATLDLFKLIGTSKSGSVDLLELSRALVKFDLDPLRALTGSVLNVAHPSFKCVLTLRDVYGGQPTPSGFTLAAVPVSRSWDEGIGSDVVLYNDIDSANWLTASYASGAASLWFLSGANKGGLLGSSDIDVVLSGNLSDGLGVSSLAVSQTFTLGTEDVSRDVTRIVSATLARQLPDEGFRLAFVPGEESDGQNRFVKRFAARHAFDSALRPRLVVRYDDAIQDNQANSFFDLTNTVFLYNYDRDGLANLTSGSAATPITGSNSLVMRLVTDTPAVGVSGGLYHLVVTASQHSISGRFMTGTYSASYSIRSSDRELAGRLALSSSIQFTQVWGSLDGTVGYLTQSRYVIRKQPRRIADRTQRSFMTSVTNLRPSYAADERAHLRLFVQPVAEEEASVSRVPLVRKSEVFHRSFYSIRDAYTDDVIVPFETRSNATRLSTDGEGMFFDLFMSDLDPGRTYEIDLLVKDDAVDQVYRNVGTKFRVDLAG